MNGRLFAGVLAVLTAAGPAVFAAAGTEPDGKQIARMAEDANTSSRGVVVKGTMELTDLARNDTESRRYIIVSVTVGGLRRSLFRFLDSSYRGTTFLTQERSDGDKLQYLFLKSVGSPRQIEASDKENSFVDTDISNEEMGGSSIEDYTYARLDDARMDGRDCYVIEKFPKRSGSRYSKHLEYIDKEHLVPLAVKSYGREGRVAKTIRAGDIRKVSENIRMPFVLTVTSVADRHRTVVKVETAEEKTVNRGYFNRNRMGMKLAEE